MLTSFILLIIAAVIILMALPKLRQRFFTRYVFRWFKRKLPSMSRTEKEAIAAGDVAFEGDLFRGQPDWDNLFKAHGASLTKEEESFLNIQTETLCRMLNDWEIMQARDLPAPVWDYLKNEGFFGMIIPKRYGGLEFSAKAHSAVIIKIGARSPSAAVTAMVPNSLGPAELLLQFGTKNQQDYYLPRLAKGEEIPCFALTSPYAGSDAGAMTDYGIVTEGEWNGKKVLGLRVSWSKRYITLAPIATLVGLAIRVYDPNQLLGSQYELGVTLLLLPKEHAGVNTGPRHNPLFLAFLNGTTHGQDVFVPFDYIIGDQAMLGQGWRMLMTCLAAGRGISLPALSSATAQMCYRTCGAYAYLREQFKVSIGEFEGVQMPLGRVAGLSYLMESARNFTLHILDQGHKPAIISAMMKYHMTELGRQIINDAMDIHGGKGIIVGPQNYLAASYLGTPISITVEGANILTRSLIIFGQGAFRCHPFVRFEAEAAENADFEAGLVQFDQYFIKHLWYAAKTMLCVFYLGLTCGFGAIVPVRDDRKRYLQKILWLSKSLSFVSEVSMLVLGGRLKRKENLSARLGDVLSMLYLASSVLWYSAQQALEPKEKEYVNFALKYCVARASEAMQGFFKNFPHKWLGALLELWCFPFTMAAEMPNDDETLSLARHAQYPSLLRDRLSALVIPKTGEESACALLEKAFIAFHQAEPVYDKIKAAVKTGALKFKTISLDQNPHFEEAYECGIINKDELEQIKIAEKLRMDVIQVDAFKKE